MDLQDQFLVAMPGQSGSYFTDSLIYLCEHNDEGAMGLIINRPTDLSVLELAASVGLQVPHRWAQVVVNEGGPVAPEQGIALHSTQPIHESAGEIAPGVWLSSAMQVLEALASKDDADNCLLWFGYAGWGPGQLEGEVATNVWLTLPADRQVLFEEPAQTKLQRATNAQGIDMRLMATRPGHA